MMNRQEIKVGALALALIVGGVIAIKFGKLKLGNPGLVIEAGTLTNELGKVVRTERIRFPSEVPGYHARDSYISTWEDGVLPKDTRFGRKIYWNDEGFGAQMSAVLMKSDRTSIHRPQVCVTGQGWQIDKTEEIKIPIPLPRPYELTATLLTTSKEVRAGTNKYPMKGMYIFWFISEHRLAANHPKALWHITEDLLLTGTLYPWGYVSCFSSCPPGSEDLWVARMKRLIATTAPHFQMTTGAGKESAFLGEADSLPFRAQIRDPAESIALQTGSEARD